MKFRIFIFLLPCFFILKAKSAEYEIPSSMRFSIECEESAPPVVYYFSQPPLDIPYPILILCEGSSGPGNIQSVLYIRNYFLKQVESLNTGYLTIEKRGVDGNRIDEEEFWKYYSRSQRLTDHLKVINHLQEHSPKGWNGKFILIGVSEGGPLVTDLSMISPRVIATINWVGAGDSPWADQLWHFFEKLEWRPPDMPGSRQEFDALVEHIIANPTPHQSMAGMTYFYHADAFQKAPIDYSKIRCPLLVVQGTEDSTIDSCDQFVLKAQEAGVPVTYFRINGMDHYIRHRPDVIDQSFDWLKVQLSKEESK